MTSEAEAMGRSVFWRQEIGTEMQSNNLGQIAVARILEQAVLADLTTYLGGIKIMASGVPLHNSRFEVVESALY